MAWEHRRLARWVHTSDRGVQAQNLFGEQIELTWQEIAECQLDARWNMGGWVSVLRIMSRDRRRRIGVSNRIEAFDELVDEVRTRATDAVWSTPTGWERLTNITS